jgi:hypothetical protein
MHDAGECFESRTRRFDRNLRLGKDQAGIGVSIKMCVDLLLCGDPVNVVLQENF